MRCIRIHWGKIRRAITDSLARELPTSLPFSPHPSGLPLSFCSRRSLPSHASTCVCIPHDTSCVGSLCAGRSTETGTLDQPIRRLVRARPLTLKRRKSPRVHIPAWSTVRDRLRLLDRGDTWDTSANTAIYDDTMLHMFRDVHWNLRIPFRTVKWKRVICVISRQLYFNYSFVCAFGIPAKMMLNFSVYSESRKNCRHAFFIICSHNFSTAMKYNPAGQSCKLINIVSPQIGLKRILLFSISFSRRLSLHILM